MRIGFIIGGVALAALIILAFQYGGAWFGDTPNAADEKAVAPNSQTPAQVIDAAPEPVPAQAEVPEVVLPELNTSDPFVVEHLANIGVLASWIDREDLVRRLSVVIDNAPRGEYPRGQLGFLAPTGTFKVSKRGDDIFLDPASYARYDTYIDAVEVVDPEQLAQTIDLLVPLIAQGLGELGNQQPVVEQINAAIGRITALPGLGSEVRLLQPEVLYQFADPQLEALSPLQKQALRLGPDNLARLQDYLRRFQDAFAETSAFIPPDA